MKKTLLLLAVIMMTSMSFTCSNGDSTSSEKTDQPQAQTTEKYIDGDEVILDDPGEDNDPNRQIEKYKDGPTIKL